MGDVSNELFSDTLGLRFREIEGLERPACFLSTTYSDESGLSASIEYVSDGNGNETVPVFVTKAGSKVYIPPSIADLLRDKPPDQLSGSEYDDDEGSGTKLCRNTEFGGGEFEDDADDEDDFDMTDCDLGGSKLRKRGRKYVGDECDGSETELDGIQVVAVRKASVASDIFQSDLLSLVWEQFAHVGLRLLPFLKTLVLYFVLFIPEEKPSMFAMMIKCLPILSLVLFIILYGVGMAEEHKFSRKILFGLMFSCMGDAFLIWPDHFLYGMISFGIAQTFYIRAFGFKPLNLKLLLIILMVNGSNLTLILPGLMKQDIAIRIGVMIYSSLLTTMIWRAVSRVDFSSGEITWSKLSACVGAISFGISDSTLGFNQFYTSVPYHQNIVMATYYAAQFGIALSVVSLQGKASKSKDAAVKSPTRNSNHASSEHSNGQARLRKTKVEI